MTTKYLEIDSTYRNRTIWHNPSEFEVIVSQSGRYNSAQQALDPVALATPIESWVGNSFRANNLSLSPTVTATVKSSTGLGNASGNTVDGSTVIVLTAIAGYLNANQNYYNNAVISVPNQDPSISSLVYSRVTSYTYFNPTTSEITVSPAVPISPGNTVTIYDPTDVTTSSIFIPAGSNINNYYNNYDSINGGAYISDDSIAGSSTNWIFPIDSYDGTTGIAHVGYPISSVGWANGHNFSLRYATPLFVQTSLPTASLSNIVLGTIANNYPITSIVGSYVHIPINYSGPTPSQIVRITSYDPVTTTATVTPSFNPIASSVFYELLQFSYDNFNPFTYIGTVQNEQRLNSIKLLSLTLPNTTIATGNGGTASLYPYVYVELSPIDLPMTNYLCSNNPNATRVIFRASYVNYDNSNQSKLPFVHLIGDNMVQKVNFMVDTNLKFKITLPNGSLFITNELDQYSPLLPNPDVQITALFEIVRDPVSDLFKRL